MIWRQCWDLANFPNPLGTIQGSTQSRWTVNAWGNADTKRTIAKITTATNHWKQWQKTTNTLSRCLRRTWPGRTTTACQIWAWKPTWVLVMWGTWCTLKKNCHRRRCPNFPGISLYESPSCNICLGYWIQAVHCFRFSKEFGQPGCRVDISTSLILFHIQKNLWVSPFCFCTK